MVLLFLFINISPTVASDGMPAIRYGTGDEERKQIMESIFESRQLATVELINNTHQKISLFLSVYSLDPGDNLTILVPLRTLPVGISGEPMKEKSFKDEYKIARAEKEVNRQDLDFALGKLGSKTNTNLEYAFGTLLWTYLGEYTRQEFHMLESDYVYGDEKLGVGGDGGEIGKPEPVQHYEFDGFSIDVFGVSAGPVLSDYLTEKGLAIPEIGGLDEYLNQYVAVIESKTKPPIDESEFSMLQEFGPNVLITLKKELKEDPNKDAREIERLKWDLKEYLSEYSLEIGSYNLRYYIDNLVDAVFGETNFAGEVIKIELPLDNNKLFFPLGTSAGWENKVGDIDILFKVPEKKALSLPNSKDAYFDGQHWYLVQMENANPDFDLESKLEKSDSEKRNQMEQAAFIYDNAQMLSYIIFTIFLLSFWFIIAELSKFIQKKFSKEKFINKNKKKGKKILNIGLLLMFLGALFLFSIMGVVLLYLLIKPIQINKLGQDHMFLTLIISFIISIFIFSLVII
jgi:hypothetical protein